MSDKKVLELIPMVDFLSQILGAHCEVVLHDLADKESSIVAIANGHLSGREVGGAATDYVLKTLHTGSYKTKNFECNYIAKTKSKVFSSSSYFVKDDDGEIVGTLCINIDSAPYREAAQLIEQFLGTIAAPRDTADEPEEQLFGNTQEIVSSMVEQSLSKFPVPMSRLSAEEKTGIVKDLMERGAFQLRGAASEISAALGVSEPTIYRYLNKVK